MGRILCFFGWHDWTGWFNLDIDNADYPAFRWCFRCTERQLATEPKPPKRAWLHRFCLLTGTTFTGKDGHKYGNHKKDWKHMYEWSEVLVSGYISDIRVLKKRIKVLEAVIRLCPECDKSALVLDRLAPGGK